MPTGRINARSVQVVVRLPLELHAVLVARGQPVAAQIVEAVRQALEAAPAASDEPAAVE